jgi:HPr Serine kinase C-terminal domain
MSAEPRQYWARSFGLLWQSDIEIEHFASATLHNESADIVVCEMTCLSERDPIERINRGFVYTDGFRFDWNGIVTFDMFNGNRIEYLPGPQWTGVLPWPFYSTVTALLLAWRGLLPFHGCAVSIEGQGILICGESGAGKSSLTAVLVAEGARFLSDDLSVVEPDKDGNGWSIVMGRPGIRLFPTVGSWFFGDYPIALLNDPRGKVIATPAISPNESSVPLRQIIFLGGPEKPVSAIGRFMLLRKNLFRPNWLGKLPGIAAIRVAVRDISASAQVSVEPVIGETDEHALRARAGAIIDGVRSAG